MEGLKITNTAAFVLVDFTLQGMLIKRGCVRCNCACDVCQENDGKNNRVQSFVFVANPRTRTLTRKRSTTTKEWMLCFNQKLGSILRHAWNM